MTWQKKKSTCQDSLAENLFSSGHQLNKHSEKRTSSSLFLCWFRSDKVLIPTERTFVMTRICSANVPPFNLQQ